MRSKYIIRKKESDVVLGLLFTPPKVKGEIGHDIGDWLIVGRVKIGGPKVFEEDAVEALGAFHEGKVFRLGTKKRRDESNVRQWEIYDVSCKAWMNGLCNLRMKGWSLKKVRRFRRLMG